MRCFYMVFTCLISPVLWLHCLAYYVYFMFVVYFNYCLFGALPRTSVFYKPYV